MKDQINIQITTQKRCQADGIGCFTSNANDRGGAGNTTISPHAEVRDKSGCKRGLPGLVPSRPEALTGLAGANSRSDVMCRGKGDYLNALLYYYFSKTINQIPVNFSVPM